ncbi:unnamed protein product [Bursaphelenchus okinawaensis]|uniref:CNH domain-containing protein n=1 Tax=Bursaphelenchus okinawaensis TaxID=465554 RepID=A0A811KMX5_9BILA|nr:unnamed protein product [Bursaphelenchus okinawaensis]CAG9106434.1 unnamed protein product [Bursaphelenchus okinawaensis]
MDLFDLKVVANFGQKSTDDPVTAFTGTREKLLFGTHKGKLIRCRMENDQLVYDKSVLLSNQDTIKQLVYVQSHDLLMAVVDNGIVHITESTMTLLATTGSGSVISLAVCQKESSEEQELLFAVSTNKKGILLCKRHQHGGEVTVDIVKKITVNGNVENLCFNADSICYALDQTYYVLELDGGSKEHHELISTTGTTSIEAIGENEYCIAADDGLLIFVNAKGTATRPPLTTKTDVVGLEYKEPLLYVIGNSHLHIYNLNDENFKESLATENLTHITSTENDIYVLSGDKVASKVVVADYEKLVHNLYAEDGEKGLEALETIKKTLVNDEKAQKFCQSFIEKTALKYIEEGKTEAGLKLFFESDADPIIILSQVPRLNTNAAQEMIFQEIKLDNEEIQSFLESYMSKKEEDEVKREVMSYLIRLELLMDKVDVDHLNESMLFDDELREWILENGYHSLAAEICFENGLLSEGFEIWRDYSDKTDDDIDFDGLMFRLGTVLDNPELVQDTLHWLAPKSPENAMELINQLPNLDFDWILQNFKNKSPRFVLDYFRKHLDSEDVTPQSLVEVVRIYSLLIKEDSMDLKLRKDFRNIVLNVDYNEEIDEILKENECLKFEYIIFTTRLQNVEESLKRLVEEDLELAEALFIRFCDQKPEIVYTIAPFYLKDNNSDNSLRDRFLHLLTETRPFRGIEKFLPNLKSSSPTELLSLVQATTERTESDIQMLKLRNAIASLAIVATSNRTKNMKKFTIVKEGDECFVCKQKFGHQNITFVPQGTVHTRCVRRL